jgi:uncharacterized protein YndB with AHSA1/START domain
MMTDPSVTHATFSLERTYPVPPSRVFDAWAKPEAKRRWFAGPDAEHNLDFRVGGREMARGAHDGKVLVFESVYQDIVAGQRIVYSSTLRAAEDVATVSITTVEFTPEGDATRLLLTEQGTYLDGLEQPSWREQGTAGQLDALAAELTARETGS